METTIDIQTLKEETIQMENEVHEYLRYIHELKNQINENKRYIQDNCEHNWVRDYQSCSEKTEFICTKCGL